MLFERQDILSNCLCLRIFLNFGGQNRQNRDFYEKNDVSSARILTLLELGYIHIVSTHFPKF